MCALHILLQSELSEVEVNAAECMLCDFYKLLPELYGEKSCTANVHLLSHLTKYVRLWGPLWTHSSFGYENKNGTIKHFFHNRLEVVTQLLFNIDVSVTLQHLYPVLRTSEAEATIQFLSPLSNTPGQRCMIKLGEHLYIVGKPRSTILQEDEATALGPEADGAAEVFTRLFKEGVLYHSKPFRTEGKRDDTMCSYRHQGRIFFGQIVFFVSSHMPCAVIRMCIKQQQPDGDGRTPMQRGSKGAQESGFIAHVHQTYNWVW